MLLQPTSSIRNRASNLPIRARSSYKAQETGRAGEAIYQVYLSTHFIRPSSAMHWYLFGKIFDSIFVNTFICLVNHFSNHSCYIYMHTTTTFVPEGECQRMRESMMCPVTNGVSLWSRIHLPINIGVLISVLEDRRSLSLSSGHVCATCTPRSLFLTSALCGKPPVFHSQYL